MSRIKICGIFEESTVPFINEAAPDFAGFVFYEKSHRNVSLKKALRLRELIDESIPTAGVFVNEDPEFIKRAFDLGIMSTVQLHGSEDAEYIDNLRKMIPGAAVWKAFRIRSADDLIDAEQSTADMVLLDNGYGTGKTFDWSVIEKRPERPFILAGGINTENMEEAVRRYSPYMLDLSSSVETEGKKDGEKIIRAVNAARRII